MKAARNKTVPPAPTRQPSSARRTPRGARHSPADRLETIITRDPGGRGLRTDGRDNPVRRCRGQIGRAAADLAGTARRVMVVTGFHVRGPHGPTIETDGPAGAIALAWFLSELGAEVMLMTDPLGAAILQAGLDAAALGPQRLPLRVFPFENDDPASPERRSNELAASAGSTAFSRALLETEQAQGLTHLVAIERAGPSHAAGPHRTALGADAGDSGDPPPDSENQVHNFRGQVITAQTGKIHLLFDQIREARLPVRTIGIGDGGNEIGMGCIPRRVLDRNIAGGLGARIACRIATDWTICCGVSNWGAYALGAAVAQQRGAAHLVAEWTDERERNVLGALVAAGAVDGVTGKLDPSVDGLPLEEHLEVWRQIRAAVLPPAGG